MTINIGDVEEIYISRLEANFDRACDTAYQRALWHFGIDQDGHSTKVKHWERSCCWIEVDFVTYKRIGSEHLYFFKISTARNEEDKDDREED
jgi:hypothetical protein